MTRASHSRESEPDMSCSDSSSSRSQRSSARTALQQSLHYLSRRGYSVWELEKRLQSAQYTQPEREQAVAQLREWGYLDDDKFARAYCCSKKERCSRRKVVFELLNKGVSRQCIDSALAQEYDEEEELRHCRRRMLREWDKLPKPLESSTTKVWDSLVEKFKVRFARKGYPCAIIEKIIDEEWAVFFPSYTKET